jgi:hypothetical protein
MESLISQYRNLTDDDNNFKFVKEKNNFQIYGREDYNSKNIHKIIGEIPCNYKKCITFLSDPEIREKLSKGLMKCEIIEKINDKNWFERVVFESKLNLDPIYSVERVAVEDNLIYTYSKEPESYIDNFDGDKRDNDFSCFKCYPITENLCLITVVLTFDEFEMGQDMMIDGTIDYLNRLIKALIK